MKTSDRQICKWLSPPLESADKELLQELYASVPKYGPFCSREQESENSLFKDETWSNVLKTSPTGVPKTIDIYMNAVRGIEEQCRRTYANGSVDHLSQPEFLWMMIKDGCFLLQLTLLALGGDPPPRVHGDQSMFFPDSIFGENNNNNMQKIKKLVASMFFVGNQVPLVALKELMKQDHFQGLIKAKQNWKEPTDLFGKVLYQLLLLPELESSSSSTGTGSSRVQKHHLFQGLTENFARFENENYSLRHLKTRPSDLLHGLQSLVLGPRETEQTTEDEREDEEEGAEGGEEDDEEERDLEANCENYSKESKFGRIPSATELKRAGVHFKTCNGKGIRGIKFRSFLFGAVLTLPTFRVDEDTEMLFRFLKNYERTQKFGVNSREVSSYIKFMSELIQTPEDAELLASHGIIQANNAKQRDKLPRILRRMASTGSCKNLRLVRLKIKVFVRPTLKRFIRFLSFVLVLSLIQTLYTVLDYYKP